MVLVAVVVATAPPGDLGGGGRARRGGVLRLGVPPPGNLDPAQARSTGQPVVADQLFDSLTALDPETLDPLAAVAARWETADQRAWTFHLRDGAAFANGRPVTGADVTPLRLENDDGHVVTLVPAPSLYHEPGRAVLDRVPVVPIGQSELHAVVSHRVRSLVPTSTGTFGAAAVTVEDR